MTNVPVRGVTLSVPPRWAVEIDAGARSFLENVVTAVESGDRRYAEAFEAEAIPQSFSGKDKLAYYGIVHLLKSPPFTTKTKGRPRKNANQKSDVILSQLVDMLKEDGIGQTDGEVIAFFKAIPVGELPDGLAQHVRASLETLVVKVSSGRKKRRDAISITK